MYWSRYVKMLITKRIFHRDVAISKILFNPPNIKMLVISNLRTHFLEKSSWIFIKTEKLQSAFSFLHRIPSQLPVLHTVQMYIVR